ESALWSHHAPEVYAQMEQNSLLVPSARMSWLSCVLESHGENRMSIPLFFVLKQQIKMLVFVLVSLYFRVKRINYDVFFCNDVRLFFLFAQFCDALHCTARFLKRHWS